MGEKLTREQLIERLQRWAESQVEGAAARAYTAYCAAVGGVAFNGDSLLAWEAFAADPANAQRVAAWREAAKAATGIDEPADSFVTARLVMARRCRNPNVPAVVTNVIAGARLTISAYEERAPQEPEAEGTAG